MSRGGEESRTKERRRPPHPTPDCPHISLARGGRTSTHKTVFRKGVGHLQGFMPAPRHGGEWVPDSRQAPPQEERPAGMSALKAQGLAPGGQHGVQGA